MTQDVESYHLMSAEQSSNKTAYQSIGCEVQIAKGLTKEQIGEVADALETFIGHLRSGVAYPSVKA